MFAYCSGDIIAHDGITLTVLPKNTGLGIEVLASPNLLAHTTQSDTAQIWLHHHITDVSQVLFGFVSPEERDLFRHLIRVNGIGGKTALNMLGLGAESLLNAIHTEDDALLSTIPGIGKKTAQKIIVDLKGSIQFHHTSPKHTPSTVSVDTPLIQSLIAMGYDRHRVERVLSTIDPTLSLEETVKIAIKQLA